MSSRAATFLAERLPHGLQHPGDETHKPFVIPLPLGSSGMPPELAEQFAAAAGMPSSDVPKLVGEAIAWMLETDGGFVLMDRAEVDELRQQAADAPDGARVVEVYCPRHGKALVEVTVGKTDRVDVDCALIAKALEHHA